MAQKLRPDLQTLIEEYNNEMAKPAGSRQVTRLEKFVVAVQKLQDTPWDKGDLSYFYLASYHGYSSDEVFGHMRSNTPERFRNSIFCPHALPEFPAWHRILLSKYEKALQSIDPSVSLPYWNQISALSQDQGYPPLLDQPNFQKSDGSTIRNSLVSFKTTENINFNGISVPNQHETSRNPRTLTQYLSSQIMVDLKKAMKQTAYEMFSHNSQAFQWSIEKPHSNVHNEIGGWMPLVPISAFDPIFWMHHCFYDLLFWVWQVKNGMTDQITFRQSHLQLVPFQNNSTGTYYVINDVANIKNFGYNYPDFNIDELKSGSQRNRRSLFEKLGKPLLHKSEGSKKVLTVGGIRFSHFGGSFKIEVIAKTASGKIPLGKHSVFRVSSGCSNCEVRPLARVSFSLKNVPVAEEKQIKFRIIFILQDNTRIEFSENLTAGIRHVRKVMGLPMELVY